MGLPPGTSHWECSAAAARMATAISNHRGSLRTAPVATPADVARQLCLSRLDLIQCGVSTHLLTYKA